MNVTGSHINYYFICKRKLWLFEHDVQMEQESENVKIGKLISESSYQRKRHEIEVSDELTAVSPLSKRGDGYGVKIDFYDKQTNTIHEIKKTDSFQEAHVWQVLYYIYVLKHNGVAGVKGELDYPKMKKRVSVELTPEKERELENILERVRDIIESEKPMTVEEAGVKMGICRKCSYFELCYS